MQRNCIDRGLQQIELDNNDILVITDLDEIPDRNTLLDIKTNYGLENTLYALEQDMYFYNLTCHTKIKWYHPKLLNYYTYKNSFHRTSDNIRICSEYKVIHRGGWHLSYFGNVEFIKNKIKHFAHQEFNNTTYLDDEKIIQQIKNSRDLYFRDECGFEYYDLSNNTYLPDNFEVLLTFGAYNNNSL
jgi:beta-1,4-mannosyl-glycoprotein beta-1,4-N-acetylglucosaminyltransferase